MCRTGEQKGGKKRENIKVHCIDELRLCGPLEESNQTQVFHANYYIFHKAHRYTDNRRPTQGLLLLELVYYH